MITLLDEENPTWFPDPKDSSEDGLVAVSEKLGTGRLVEAYRIGIFPWMKMDHSPNFWCWFSPNPRMVLYPEKLIISDSLQRVIKNGNFEIKVDFGFTETMRACASAKRPKQEATWIEEDMIREYTKLHNMGITHSVEAFLNGERVGGLYGLAMGEVFFGESMFHTVSNASKVCLVYLTDLCRKAGVRLIDCQVYTKHLESMGAEEITREQYLETLKNLISSPKSVIDWDLLS